MTPVPRAGRLLLVEVLVQPRQRRALRALTGGRGVREVHVHRDQGPLDRHARLQRRESLAPGSHTIELVVTGRRNPARYGYTFLDAFQVS